MTQLTPLEETVAVRELIKRGMEEGIQEGVEKGILINRIHTAQRFKNQQITPKEALMALSVDELEKKLSLLDSRSA